MLKIVFFIEFIAKQNIRKIACLAIITFLIESCHPNIQDLKQEYSTEIINYFYETVFFQDNIGKVDKVNKWGKDIYIFVSGDFSMTDMVNIKTTISQLDSLQLPINMYLTSDSSLANLLVYFGDYLYLEEKMNIHYDYAPFVGMGVFKEGKPYIESTVVGFSNDAKRYKRLDQDSIKLRHAIIIEELTQCLGIIGDSWHYPKSVFFEGGISVSNLSIIDKGVVRLLYEPSIPTQYTRQQFEKDFGDVLYHIHAPQKIANYILANNIPSHHLKYIREKCFHDSILVKCPSELHISLKGDFLQEDSVFCRDVVNLFNSVTNNLQLVFANSFAHETPGINIYYERNNKQDARIERQMTTDDKMMFSRRVKGEIKVTYREQDAQEINKHIFGSMYKLLGFDHNNTDRILKLDSLGNISFNPDYKEMLALIYEPVLYSGLTLKEFDEAIEILKDKRNYSE